MTTRAGWIGPMDASRVLSMVLGVVAAGLVFLGFGLFPNPPYHDPLFLAVFAGTWAVARLVQDRERGTLRALGRGLATGLGVVVIVLAMGAIHEALRPTVEHDPRIADLWGDIVVIGCVFGGFAAVLSERTSKRRRDAALGLLLYGLIFGGSILAFVGSSYALLGVFLAGVGLVWAFVLHERGRLAREALERAEIGDPR